MLLASRFLLFSKHVFDQAELSELRCRLDYVFVGLVHYINVMLAVAHWAKVLPKNIPGSMNETWKWWKCPWDHSLVLGLEMHT